MKQLEIRAWCPKNKEMYTKENSPEYQFEIINGGLTLHTWNEDEYAFETGIEDSESTLNIIPMLFLNLTVKDSVKVFEGDIVRYPDMKEVTRLTSYHRRSISEKEKESVYRVGEICFFDGATWVRNNGSMFCLAWAMAYQGSPHELPLNAQSIEVIGNIYQNPELLKIK